jgi:hypothetical protein
LENPDERKDIDGSRYAKLGRLKPGWRSGDNPVVSEDAYQRGYSRDKKKQSSGCQRFVIIPQKLKHVVTVNMIEPRC